MECATEDIIAKCSTDQYTEMGDILVEYLRQLQVEYVFGVPGGAIEPLYNALARSAHKGGPRSVVARHETGAAFMAQGYARYTGRLGVCCSTTGPGATNLITGVSSAYENRTPLLVITAQTALTTFGARAFQESSCTGIDTVSMFHYCTCYSSLISHVEQVERKLSASIMRAFQTSTPAHLSIPLDILRSPAPQVHPKWDLSTHMRQFDLIDDAEVKSLCQQLMRAKNVVIVLGDSGFEGIGNIIDTAILIGAKVLATPQGKGFISSFHPLFFGVIGFAGHRTANQVLSDPTVDLVLAVGTPFSEWTSNGWDPHLLNNKLIHIDPIESNLTHSPMAKLHVRGNIHGVFGRVVDYLNQHDTPRCLRNGFNIDEIRQGLAEAQTRKLKMNFELDDEAKCYDESTPIKPQRLMRELPRLFPPTTYYVADTGNSMAWAIHYLHPYDRRIAGHRNVRGGRFGTCVEFASMGWAIGCSVGIALAQREHPVVCITGDGSMLMSGQELTVALQKHLSVVFIVLNDSALGMVKHGQRLSNAESIGFELPSIDYAQFAKSMGVPGYTVHSPQDLLMLDIDAILSRGGPALFDVKIDPDEVPPMIVRIRGLTVNEPHTHQIHLS